MTTTYTTVDKVIVSGTTSLSSNSVTSLSGAQYSLDDNSINASWSACSGTTAFTCSLASLGENDHTVYVRAYDSNTAYTLQINHLSTSNHLPTFTFTKAGSATADINKYQIFVRQEGSGYSIYLDNLSHDHSSGTILDEENRYVRYDGDEISCYSKRSQDQLANGAYRWKVKAIDKAGNSTETEEKTLLINTHTANFSGEFFPLTVLNIGGVDTQITTLDPTTYPSSLAIADTTPTFFGIAPMNTTVSLTLKQNNQIIVAQETIANPESRFGINITTPLASGEYTAKISATNLAGDYVEIPEFTLIVGSSGTVAGETTAQPTLPPLPSPKPTPQLQLEPSPSQPTLLS